MKTKQTFDDYKHCFLGIESVLRVRTVKTLWLANASHRVTIIHIVLTVLHVCLLRNVHRAVNRSLVMKKKTRSI